MNGTNFVLNQLIHLAGRWGLLLCLLVFAIAGGGCGSDGGSDDGLTLYDDFTGTYGGFPSDTKWNQEIGWNMYISSGNKLIMMEYGIGVSPSSDTRILMVDAADPGSVTAIQAEIKVSEYTEDVGDIRMLLGGVFYNDENTAGGAAGSSTSDIWASIQLHNFVSGTGETLYTVARCEDSICGTTTELASGDLGTVDISEAGTYKIEFNSDSSTFTFSRDGTSVTEDLSATASYKIGPNSPDMEVGIRTSGFPDGSMSTVIDNFKCKGCTVP